MDLLSLCTEPEGGSLEDSIFISVIPQVFKTFKCLLVIVSPDASKIRPVLSFTSVAVTIPSRINLILTELI